MTDQSTKNKLISLIPILLFAILAVSVLTVLFSGAKAYASISKKGETSFATRTAAQYVSTKLRQTDGVIDVDSFGGESSVTLTETINGKEYVTRIYCYDGYLYELFSAADADVSPEDGEKLLQTKSMTATIHDGLLTVDIDGRTLVFALRTREA